MRRTHWTLFLMMLGMPLSARAASVTLAWDPEAVDGFRVYYGLSTAYDGTEAVQGPSPIMLPSSSLADPNNPSFVLDGLSSCSHVYFALTAYNNDGDGGILESALSNQVDITVVQKPLNVVASSSAPGTITLTWDPQPANDHGAIDTFNVHYGTSDVDAGTASVPVDGSGANEGPSPVSFPASSLADPNAPSTSLTGLADGTYFLDVESACNDGATRHSPESMVVVGQGTTTTTTSTTTSSSGSGSSSTSSSGSGSTGASTAGSTSSAASTTTGSSSSSSSSSASSTGTTGTHGTSSGSTSSTTTAGSSTGTHGSGSTSGTSGSTGEATTIGASSSSGSIGGSGAASTSAGSGSVPKEIEGGCGCGTTSELAPVALLLAALVHVRRRKLSSP
ncbi:MAG: fibronectin type III domain-containing protein [Deltaproteobacteria bacterium]|nr:fibronectin type III domain-containing protein [Deltaproteobacteria bacterium]